MVSVTGSEEAISRGAEQELSLASVHSPPRPSSPVLMSAQLHLKEELLLRQENHTGLPATYSAALKPWFGPEPVK